MTRRHKPKTPAQILAERIAARAQNLAAVNVPSDLATLPHGDDIEVTRAGDKREGKRVDEDSARRLDAFSALKEGMKPGCYDAAMRLERDVLIRVGAGDRGRHLERVDGSSNFDHTDRLVKAGRDVDAVKAALPHRDFWLLSELIAPSKDHDGGWRGAVYHVTGEHNWNAQGAAVRAACVNLREAYDKLDVVRRSAA